MGSWLFSAVRHAAVATMCGAVLATGCGGGTDDPSGVTLLDGDPRVAVDDVQGAFDIRYDSVLRYNDQNACLFLDIGGDLSVAVWPRGTEPVTTDDGRRGVDMPEYGVIAEGDRLLIAGAGGPFGGTEQDEDIIAANADLLECISPGDLLLTVWKIDELDRRGG